MLLVNGPNLNRLGQRDRAVYGSETLSDIVRRVEAVAHRHGASVRAFQSNHEGAIIDFLQQEGPNADGLVINPGALGHYGYALRDCLADLCLPIVEVHISNVHKREPFRHQLVLSGVVTGQIVGLGAAGYELAAAYLLRQAMPEGETS
ncbi:type II 3-dehydroquinate dehydratase [Alicyclobacillus cycloheptanicus]|nr:type II 3-dehydroquinate dehydratase [Alicyclobacillus cycloheptanicus]